MFAALDWLIRGTGPAYINRLFGSCAPVNRVSAIKLATMRRVSLLLYRFLGYRRLDTSKPRPMLKQIAVSLTQKAAAFADRSMVNLARWEWNHRRHAKNGSAQYLVFMKVD